MVIVKEYNCIILTDLKKQYVYISSIVELTGNVINRDVVYSTVTEQRRWVGNEDGNLNPKEEYEENKKVNIAKSINIYLVSFLSFFKVMRLCKVRMIIILGF